MTRRSCAFVFAAVSMLGCGVASVSPLVTNADLVNEPRLAGTWRGPKESVVLTAIGPSTFDAVYTDEDGKIGHFEARFGRLGSYRVLDLQPNDPLPKASDAYKSLLVRAHGLIVVDSVGDVIRFRMIEGDSLKAYLKRRPQAVEHVINDDGVVLTASSTKARQFLLVFVQRAGVLTKAEEWRRVVPHS